MKTTKRQQFEIVFWSFFIGLLGFASGYYWAASTAAEMVKESLAK